MPTDEQVPEAFPMPPAALALRDYMIGISQEGYCAHWMAGLEYALWSACHGGRRHYGNTEITDEQVQTLLELSDACRGWIVWRAEAFDATGELGAEQWVPLDTWIPRFEAMAATTRTRLAAMRAAAPWMAPLTLSPEWQDRLVRAVLNWRGQGAASKWTTGPSRHLAGTVDELRREYRDYCDRLVPPPRVTGDCEYEDCDQEAKVRMEDGTKFCAHHGMINLAMVLDAADVQMAVRNARPLWSTRIVDDGAEIPRCNQCGMQMARVAGPGPKSEWTCARCDPGPEDLRAYAKAGGIPLSDLPQGPKAPGPDDQWWPTEADTEPQDWYFTFGSGHHHYGDSLAKRYVRIHGTAKEARREMVKHFGFAWSHQYRTPEGAGVEQFGLTEFELPKEASDG